MQLDPGITPDAIEQALKRAAQALYGSERTAALQGRLHNTSQWLARIAAAPVEFAGDPPEHSGVEGETR